MGRDDHKKPRGRNRFAQTPKNQLSDGVDVEFSEEFADDNDREAQARSKAADRRAKE